MSTERIKEIASNIKCSYIKCNIDSFLLEVAAEEYTPEQAIELLLERENALRKENGITRRLSRAHFPYQMSFDLFTSAHLSKEVAREVRVLETLNFIEEGSNVVLIGNPGVGKTALSIALGTKACREGKTVAFINIPNLVIEIKEAMSLNQLTAYKKSFEKYDLVILDDLCYCSFNKECGEVLFNLLSSRLQKAPIIVTTNLTFNRWNEVFNDPVLTGCIVDRVAHRAHVVDMTGESYRVIETKEWLEKTQNMK